MSNSTSSSVPLGAAERTQALVALPDWRHNLGALHAVYEAPSVADALGLVQSIGAAAEAADHHPDVDWRYRHVFIRSTTHSTGHRVSALDLDLAAAISAAAAAVGAQSRPELQRSLELGIDTVDPAGIAETWKAALGYKSAGETDLYDPWGRLPSVWFQPTQTPNPSRLHVDLTVEDSAADAVLAEITAHGGSRVDDSFRPSWTVVADADGNRICVCTDLGRED